MTKAEEDILFRFIQAMRQSGATFSDEIAVQVEMQLRQEVGGQRVYIPKAPARVKTQRLATAIRTGAKISEAMAQAGVHKTWGYALMSRKIRIN